MLLILRTIAEFFLLGCLALVCGRTILGKYHFSTSLPLHLGLFAAVAGGIFSIDPLAAAGWICILGGSVAMLFFPKSRSLASIKSGWKGLVLTVAVTSAAVAATLSMNHLRLRQLPPALQSPWFGPHVSAYMIGYALATIGSVLYFLNKDNDAGRKIIRIALAFLMAGMSMGALWARSAWGGFWSWDPKETAAAASAAAYLAFLHLENRLGIRWNRFLLIAAFILLNLCWWGLNLLGLPSLHAAGAHY